MSPVEKLILFCAVYSITLLFFLMVSGPQRIKMICSNCDTYQKAHNYSPCKTCDRTLSRIDWASRGELFMKDMIKLGLITKTKRTLEDGTVIHSLQVGPKIKTSSERDS